MTSCTRSPSTASRADDDFGLAGAALRRDRRRGARRRRARQSSARAGGAWARGSRSSSSAFAAFSGASHAIAVANGTAALHLALLAVGCGPGDEVVLPSLNFVAAANAIVHTGADARLLRHRGPGRAQPRPGRRRGGCRTATRRRSSSCTTAAIRATWTPSSSGRAAWPRRDRRRRARAGRELRRPRVRHARRVGCFSFFSNKNLPVGEGGMIVTDDDELAERLRLLRSHGMTTLTWDRHRGHALELRRRRCRASTTASTRFARRSGSSQLRRLLEENAAGRGSWRATASCWTASKG